MGALIIQFIAAFVVCHIAHHAANGRQLPFSHLPNQPVSALHTVSLQCFSRAVRISKSFNIHQGEWAAAGYAAELHRSGPRLSGFGAKNNSSEWGDRPIFFLFNTDNLSQSMRQVNDFIHQHEKPFHASYPDRKGRLRSAMAA
jgi:hypothetical protein